VSEGWEKNPYFLGDLPSPTLLEFVCAERVPWERVLENEVSYFQSPAFDDICDVLETRILTRCAGLVEITEHPTQYLEFVRSVDSSGTSHIVERNRKGSLARCGRRVTFIHRTVRDFLEDHWQSWFQNLDWQAASRWSLARGLLGSISLIPMLMSYPAAEGRWFSTTAEGVMRSISHMSESEADQNIDPMGKETATQLVDHAYHILCRVNASLNGSDIAGNNGHPLGPLDSWGIQRLPLYDFAAFAARFGCFNYVSHYVSEHSCHQEALTYFLAITISSTFAPLLSRCNFAMELVRQGANPNPRLSQHVRDSSLSFHSSSICGTFLRQAVNSISGHILWIKTESIPTSLLVLWLETFLSNDAEGSNTILVSILGESILFEMEESALSYLERWMSISPRVREIGDDLLAVLKSKGASHWRACKRIDVLAFPEGSKVSHIYSFHLSQKESDRLFESGPCDYDTFSRAFLEMLKDCTDRSQFPGPHVLVGGNVEAFPLRNT
jgi:hypothetical protein